MSDEVSASLASGTPPAAPVPAQAQVSPDKPEPGFRWSQIESTDYRQYMANLRASGCPERVLEDIIIADVKRLFAPKEAPFKSQLSVIQATPSRDGATEPGNTRQEFALRKQLREIENEKQAVIKELLGIEIPLAPIRGWHPRTYDRYESALNTVPVDKREPVRQIQESYWETSKAYQLAQDSRFQALSDLGERFGIDREKVLQAYELQSKTMDPRLMSRYGLQQTPPAAEFQKSQTAIKELLGEPAYNALQGGPNLQLVERLLGP